MRGTTLRKSQGSGLSSPRRSACEYPNPESPTPGWKWSWRAQRRAAGLTFSGVRRGALDMDLVHDSRCCRSTGRDPASRSPPTRTTRAADLRRVDSKSSNRRCSYGEVGARRHRVFVQGRSTARAQVSSPVVASRAPLPPSLPDTDAAADGWPVADGNLPPAAPSSSLFRSASAEDYGDPVTPIHEPDPAQLRRNEVLGGSFMSIDSQRELLGSVFGTDRLRPGVVGPIVPLFPARDQWP